MAELGSYELKIFTLFITHKRYVILQLSVLSG
jgi:hypothetical protein